MILDLCLGLLCKQCVEVPGTLVDGYLFGQYTHSPTDADQCDSEPRRGIRCWWRIVVSPLEVDVDGHLVSEDGCGGADKEMTAHVQTALWRTSLQAATPSEYHIVYAQIMGT